MRHLWKALAITLMGIASVFSQQKTYWMEGFEETVWPSSSSAMESNVAASTGTWKISAAFRTTSYHNSGAASLQLSTNSYFVTPLVTGGIKSISFMSRSTGSARPLSIWVSRDGSTFSQVTTGASGSSSGFTSSQISIMDTAAKAVKVVVTSGGTAIFDDVVLVSMISPAITVSMTSLAHFGILGAGSTSASTSYSVSGTELSAGIVVAAPGGFQVSTDNSAFGPSVTLNQSGGKVDAVTVYVRFAPLAAKGTMSGFITHTSADATTKKVSVSGTSIGTEPTVQSMVSFGTLSGSSMVVNVLGGNGSGRIVVMKSGSAVDWLPTDGITPAGVNSDFSVALDQEGGNHVVYAGSGASVTVTGLAAGSTYHVAAFEYNGDTLNACNFLLAAPGTGNATTAQEPGIAVSPSVMVFENTIVGTISSEKTYSVQGSFLTPASGMISVNAPSGFELSQTGGGGFGSVVDLSYSANTLPQTTLYVRFRPTSIASYGGSITNSGGGAPAKSITVSGSGIDSSILFVKTYYVSPTGDDANAGTIDAPFFHLSVAVAKAKARDTIYMRGGTYAYSTRIDLSQSGAPGKYICLWAYPGEKPVLDFSTQPYGASYRALQLTGNYWYIKGLEICHAGDNGIKVEGSYNTIELCVLHHNGDTGIQLGFGHIFADTHPGVSKNDGTYCAYNYIRNCDSYLNYDPDSNGGDADGFACKMHNGIGNVFRGCRSWTNSDDGWDLFETDFAVLIDSCWTWGSGVNQGNGNGFKLGGDGTGGSSMGIHTVSYGVAFGHKVNGFTNNSHKDGELIINCLSFSNGTSGYNYYFEGGVNSGRSNAFKNNVTIPRAGGGGSFTYDVTPVEFNNSWNLSVTANTSDYIDLTETAALAPRQADGSLPVTFAHLVAGSDLIDKGVDVGLPYSGSAPDLGPFEYAGPTSASTESALPRTVELFQNYPNPFNPSTAISYQLSAGGHVSLRIFDLLGREVAVLVNGPQSAGRHNVSFQAAGLGSGVFFYRLETASSSYTKSMILQR